MMAIAEEKAAFQREAGQSAAAMLFELLERSLKCFVGEADGGHFGRRWLRFGSLDGGTFQALVERTEHDHPLALRAPFEGVASIAGGLWLGAELVDRNRVDGIARLRFTAGTCDLPIHAHEQSDRLIVVLDGSGAFQVSNEALAQFSAADVRHIPVQVGDVLMFTRNLLHTFSAPTSDLVLLSYHSPAIPFDDPRQYTLPERIWRPRTAGS